MNNLIIIFGFILLLAHFLRVFSRVLHLPFITIIVFLGYLLGPTVLNIIPKTSDNIKLFVSNLSLSLIGLLIGGKFLTLNREAEREFFLAATVVIVTIAVLF